MKMMCVWLSMRMARSNLLQLIMSFVIFNNKLFAKYQFKHHVTNYSIAYGNFIEWFFS
jgi:hypothetical protein